jgi:hypothetical protein
VADGSTCVRCVASAERVTTGDAGGNERTGSAGAISSSIALSRTISI